MRVKKSSAIFCTRNYFLGHKIFSFWIYLNASNFYEAVSWCCMCRARRRGWYINFNSKLLALTSFSGARQFKYFYRRVLLGIMITLQNWYARGMTFMENWKIFATDLNTNWWHQLRKFPSWKLPRALQLFLRVFNDASETEKHYDVTVSINVSGRKLVIIFWRWQIAPLCCSIICPRPDVAHIVHQ